METKFSIFEKMTLPCVIAQNDPNWVWYIFTSPSLPCLERLKTAVKDEPRIKVLLVSNVDKFYEFVRIFLSVQSNYISVRLDDDDGISPDFISKLRLYEDRDGHFIKFTNGQKTTLRDDEVVFGSDVRYRLQLGLFAAVNENVYCINHSKIDHKYPIVFDNSPRMFYVFCGASTHTKRKFTL